MDSLVKSTDHQYWETYKKTGSPEDRVALLRRFDPMIQSQVSKWSGVIPNDILTMKAKLMAAESFDTYDPTRGAALATHVMHNLAPLSRVVYSHQNAARLPENHILKLNTLNTARDHLTIVNGYAPTVDQLHQELGWSKKELERMEGYIRKDLTESAGGVTGEFYDQMGSDSEDVLDAIYFDLTPDEKILFERTTGYNGKPVLKNEELIKQLGCTQSQLSYKKRLLTAKITKLRGENG